MWRLIWNWLFLYVSLIIIISFLYWNKIVLGFQYLICVYKCEFINIYYYYLIDSISLFFLLLSCLLVSFCLLMCWYFSYRLYFCIKMLGVILFALFNLFLMVDIFMMFFFFEFIIIPLFFIVGIWGSRKRKILASYLLYIYTIVGSMFGLFGFLFLFSVKGTSVFVYYVNSFFLDWEQIVLFILLFFGFSVKVPIIPMHVWLPEAHVEAPAFGSVILAGIVLKLGFYIYLRLVVFVFYYAIYYFVTLIFLIALIGLYFSSFAALSQVDTKKIVAYSSISHMNFSLIGLFSMNLIGIIGSFFMLFAHAIVSSALFICIGILYDRYKTRSLLYFGGLVLIMPLFISFFFIVILGNVGLPGTVNFVGEITVFLGSFFCSNLVIIFSLIGLLCTLIYSLILYTRIANGKIKVNFIRFYSDIVRREFYIIFPFVCALFYIGIFPNFVFDVNFAAIYWYYYYI